MEAWPSGMEDLSSTFDVTRVKAMTSLRDLRRMELEALFRNGFVIARALPSRTSSRIRCFTISARYLQSLSSKSTLRRKRGSN